MAQVLTEVLQDILVADVISLIIEYQKRPLVYFTAGANDRHATRSLWSYDVDHEKWQLVLPKYSRGDDNDQHICRGYKLGIDASGLLEWKRFDFDRHQWEPLPQLAIPDRGLVRHVLQVTPSSYLYTTDGESESIIGQWTAEVGHDQLLTALPPGCVHRETCYLLAINDEYIYMLSVVPNLALHRYQIKSQVWQVVQQIHLPHGWEWKYMGGKRFFNRTDNSMYYGWLKNDLRNEYGLLCVDVPDGTWHIARAPQDRSGSWAIHLPGHLEALIVYLDPPRMDHFNMKSGISTPVVLPINGRLECGLDVCVRYI
jgi:hypothetical protein